MLGFLAKLILRVYCDLTAGYCQPLVSHRKPEISSYLVKWEEDPVPQTSCGPLAGGSRDSKYTGPCGSYCQN